MVWSILPAAYNVGISYNLLDKVFMAKKIDNDDDFDDDDVADDDMLNDLEEIESKQSKIVSQSDARRRLEQLKEEKELERILNDGFDEFY